MKRALAFAAVLAAFGVPLAYAQEATTAGTSTGGTTTETPLPPPLIPDGVTIAGVSVGGLTADEARLAVRAFFARPVTFTFRGRTRTTTPWWVGASAGVGSAITNALAADPGQEVALSVRFDGTRLRALVSPGAGTGPRSTRGPACATSGPESRELGWVTASGNTPREGSSAPPSPRTSAGRSRLPIACSSRGSRGRTSGP
jgi:hypothetical protein